MRIDAHVHFWHYAPADHPWIGDGMGALKRDFLPTDLDPLATAAGFDGVVAVQARPDVAETEWLLDLAARHPIVRGVVGWVDLCAPDAPDSLARLGENSRLVGIRHLVQDEPDDRFLVNPDFLRGIESLTAFDLTYDILIHPRHLSVAIDFVQRFPGQRFVLDHLAKPDLRRGALGAWRRDLRALAAQSNVTAKLSGLVTEADWSHWTRDAIQPALDAAWDAFGPDRLLIGSDWPVCTLAGDYRRVMDVVMRFLDDRPAAEQAAVLGGNAERLWRLGARVS